LTSNRISKSDIGSSLLRGMHALTAAVMGNSGLSRVLRYSPRVELLLEDR